MEKLQKEGKFSKKWILYVVIPLAVFSIAVITLFIILTNSNFQESKESNVPSKTTSGQEELGSMKPVSNENEKSIEPAKQENSQGGGGGTSSETPAAVEDVKGSLEIDNIISRDYTSSNLGLVHYSEAQEGLDKYDSKYFAMFDSSGIA